MTEALDFTLLRPLWLMALLPLAAFAVWLYRQRGGLGDWIRAGDPALLQAMAALGHVNGRSSHWPLTAALSVAAIAVFALAGPSVERRDAQSFRNLDGVLFVVDTSESVTADPRWPQMLAMGRFGLSSLGTRPAALIVFAGDAYMAADLTLDYLQLGQTFSLIDAKTVPDKGSRPARALAMAAERLAGAEVLAGDVVLFGDGAGLSSDALEQAATIRAAGARLSVVALSAPTDQMKALTGIGGGRVFTLEETDALATWLGSDARMRLERQDYPMLFWVDFGRYLLALTLVPLLFLFRRRVT